MKYNHDRELEDFQESLDIIHKAGFYPIAVTQMLFEDTFVFETAKEAFEAYELLELTNPSQVVGWWYGKEDFIKEVEEYEKEDDYKVRVYWLP